MFLPNLLQKDYFCFEDANKGNCFHKGRARKTTPDPSFGLPPILHLLELESNPKYITPWSQQQGLSGQRLVMFQCLLPLLQLLSMKKKAQKPTQPAGRAVKRLARGWRWRRGGDAPARHVARPRQSAAGRGERSQMVCSSPASRLHGQVAPCHSLPSLKGGIVLSFLISVGFFAIFFFNPNPFVQSS